ncbi:Coenzyme F420 hydrogenase/dehydrogenase, beta subunit C-terminal domain [uncultured Zobellia sp.]|uniref:Coenzyme F420 hydrogenase/dehydrogenase, beta subunit C-terminal domain n=1 Tax=uncultured Zobellia sp. TaxID=255433 RepID=UPI00259163FF|nr:Coenzyme F420 hydrogenase/dehydrogenase, beta subunit C-terminal domain [uncultured Zobellia sp.]
MTESLELYEKVIKNNYCIGCGACAIADNSPFKIEQDKFGNIVAKGDQDEMRASTAKVLDTCPFSGESKDEDELGKLFFPNNQREDNHLGRYIANYAGYVTDDNVRKIASSGGIGKWLSYTLLNEDKVDYFIQVVENKSGKPSEELFKFAVFNDPEAAVNGSTSAYYPTTLKDILTTIKETEGRYAITGVPCFIKTLRLLALKDETLKRRIKYTIGIVCGGMKSANQSKMIAWQLGVHPSNLTKINFRGKNYGVTPATTKIYQAWSALEDKPYEENSSDIYGADYGMGFFKPKACDYCDDVVGETSDISIGDVWLPNYRFDTKGYSLIVVRNEELSDLLNKAFQKGSIHLEDLSAAEAIQSQQGGFRHRREALSYRLQKKEDKGQWYPKKRVSPGEFEIDKKRKRIYDLREVIRKQSHLSFLESLEKDDIRIFYDDMKVFIKKYTIANHGVWIVRMWKKVDRRLKLIYKH